MMIERGGWFFLTGSAGTGKSYLVKELIRRARQRGERVMVCASTGIAAQHIGGATVHRAFGVFDKKSGCQVKTSNQYLLAGAKSSLLKTDFVVIDEISMLRFDVCEYVLAQINRAWEVAKGKKTVLFVGDFWQLPPVMQERDKKLLAAIWGEDYVLKGGFAFLAPTWKEKKVQMIELEEITRQNDPDFSNALNLVRHGDYAGVEWIQTHCAKQFQAGGIGIYPTNKQVLKQNTPMLDNIDGCVYSYEARLEGDAKPSDILGEEVFEFKIGASVIALANEAGGEGYCNGSVGIIRTVGKGEIGVYFDKAGLRTVKPLKRMVYSYNDDGEEVEVGSATQYPLRLSWAITVHKSQGQTYSAVNLSPSSFEAGQLYVALSRVKSVERLFLVNPIFPNDLKINQTVKVFYDNALDIKPMEVKQMFKVPKPPKWVAIIGKPPIPTFSALGGQNDREEMYD